MVSKWLLAIINSKKPTAFENKCNIRFVIKCNKCLQEDHEACKGIEKSRFARSKNVLADIGK